MEKKDIQEALQAIKKASSPRKFNQSVDLIINFKDLNLKKPEEQVDTFVTLTHDTGKPVKVCALVGAELKDSAKACDHFVASEDFEKLAANKKDLKKLASGYDFFVAQANIMTLVAKHFGRVFGPKGKMPNPKAGCVVPPNANLEQIKQRLQHVAHIKAKTELSAKVRVGTEKMDEAHVVDNALSIYQAVLRTVPNEKNNIKSVMLKLTMGKPVIIGKLETTDSKPAAKEEKAAPVEEKTEVNA